MSCRDQTFGLQRKKARESTIGEKIGMWSEHYKSKQAKERNIIAGH
jgi:hypothetical protein